VDGENSKVRIKQADGINSDSQYMRNINRRKQDASSFIVTHEALPIPTA
jgi:hypothetical protein